MDTRLVTPRFLLITVAGLAYFVALGMLFPVLPRYVEDELGGGAVAVGLSVGAFGLSSAVLRPVLGAWGDRRGRRFLIMLGGLAAAVAIAGNVVATTVTMVVAFRLATGVGEAAMFVGVASAIQDLAPPQRRAEAASYFSISVYAGLAVGPLLGELLQEQVSFDAVWLVAAASAATAGTLGWWAPSEVDPDARRPTRFLHPAALRPGSVMGVNLLAYAGFLAFIALYADEVGIGRTGLVFALFATLVVGVRLFAARVPDRMGPIATTTMAGIVSASGLVGLAVWNEPTGVFVGTAVYAIGQAFMFPALFAVAVDAAPPAQRSHAIATFSVFFDLAVGTGGFLAGAVVAFGGIRSAFALGAGLCLLSLAMVRPLVVPVLARRAATGPVVPAPSP